MAFLFVALIVMAAMLLGAGGWIFALQQQRQRDCREMQRLYLEHQATRRFVDLIPFSVFWKDRDLNYLGCNQKFAEQAGLKRPEDIVGKSDFDLAWDRREAEAHREDDNAVMEGGRAQMHAIDSTITDGKKTWLDVSKIPLQNDEGVVEGILGIFADITAQRSVQEELGRTKQLLSDAIESIDAGLVVYDSEDRLVFCNDRYRKLYSMTPEQMQPGLLYEDLLSSYAARQGAPTGDLSPDDWVKNRLAEHHNAPNDWKQFLGSRCIEISDRRTVEGGVVSLRTDVTEAMKTNQALEEARDQSERANQAKSEFLANMSHEIRTPLTAILGYLDLLADNASRDESDEYVQTIRTNADHLLRIINDILDISRIEAGHVELEEVTFAPDALVHEVKTLMNARAEAKGLKFTIDWQTQLPEHIASDPTRLRQILMNLVGNAIKFTEEGSVSLQVSWLPAEDEKGMLKIAVADTGIGMSPVQLGRLFRPFSQADSSVTRRFGGTGLGLAIARRLAHMLGGEVEVDSVVDEGTTFEVVIRAMASGQLVHARHHSPPPQIATRVALHNLDGVRILVAEDTPVNQVLVRRILSRAGAQVDVANNGVEAIERIHDADAPYQVVLMDMQMPVLDGYAATRQLRDEGYEGAIIALTANAIGAEAQRCFDAGCSDYMSKPIDRAQLIARCAAVSAPKLKKQQIA